MKSKPVKVAKAGHHPAAGSGDGWDRSADEIITTYNAGHYDTAMAMLEQRRQKRAEPHGLSVIRGWAMYHKGDWGGRQAGVLRPRRRPVLTRKDGRPACDPGRLYPSAYALNVRACRVGMRRRLAALGPGSRPRHRLRITAYGLSTTAGFQANTKLVVPSGLV